MNLSLKIDANRIVIARKEGFGVYKPQRHIAWGKTCSEVERLEVQMVAEAQLWNLYGIVGLSEGIFSFLFGSEIMGGHRVLLSLDCHRACIRTTAAPFLSTLEQLESTKGFSEWLSKKLPGYASTTSEHVAFFNTSYMTFTIFCYQSTASCSEVRFQQGRQTDNEAKAGCNSNLETSKAQLVLDFIWDLATMTVPGVYWNSWQAKFVLTRLSKPWWNYFG